MIHEAKGKYKGYQYSTYTVKRVDAHIEHGTQLCLCVLSVSRGFEGEELKQRVNRGTAQKPSEREMRIIFELLTMQSYKRKFEGANEQNSSSFRSFLQDSLYEILTRSHVNYKELPLA